MKTVPHKQNGLPLALGAYLVWGLLPLYLRLLHAVPPFEFVGWRVIFTLPFCLLLVAITRNWGALARTLSTPRTLLAMTASALLIGANWLIYIWAVQRGHVLASSLGYYINPLANVLAGTLFLGERLTRRQWQAVALASVGVSILAFGALDMLWISLSLAFTFCAYGLVRKLAPVEAVVGLTVESMLLFAPGIAIAWHYAALPAGSAMAGPLSASLLIALSGVVTAIPLVMFAAAARRMDFSTLGFVQFFSPTLAFFLGTLVFHEALKPVQLASFALIWGAIALFVLDLLARRTVNA